MKYIEEDSDEELDEKENEEYSDYMNDIYTTMERDNVPDFEHIETVTAQIQPKLPDEDVKYYPKYKYDREIRKFQQIPEPAEEEKFMNTVEYKEEPITSGYIENPQDFFDSWPTQGIIKGKEMNGVIYD